MTRTLTLAFLFAVAACGGKDKGTSTTPTTATDGSGSAAATGSGAVEGEHGELSPEMKAFHDLLAPLWHAPQGPERIANTCGAIEQFKSAANAIATATPPLAANADTWTTGTRALVSAVDELGAACKAAGVGRIETAFTAVHEAFHALMQQAGGHAAGAEHQH